MDFKSIQVDHRRRTGVITRNRPDKHNAISTAMRQYVKQVFLEKNKDFEGPFLLVHDRAFKEIILKGGNLD